MNNQLPYRPFPTLHDIRSVGLLIGTPDAPTAKQFFDISAAGEKRKAEKLSPARRNDLRRSGEINEVQFGLDAMRHDYICGKPYTNEVFDLFAVPRDVARLPVLPNGKKLKRIAIAPVALVQVRSTTTAIIPPRMTVPYYWVTTGRALDHRPYKAGEIDIFAVYIEPLKVWYIIPYDEVGGRSSISLFPHDPQSRGRYEPFKERWDLLRL